MSLRKEEEIAANSFSQWLTEQGKKHEWKPVKPDPPDIDFLVSEGNEEQHWAVEVTRLFQYVNWNGEKSAKNLEALTKDLRQRLGRIVPSDSGQGYILSVSGPFEEKLLGVIEQRASDFILSGKSAREYVDCTKTTDVELYIDEDTGEAALLLDFKEVLAEELAQVPKDASCDPQTLEAIKSWVQGNARFAISSSTEVTGVQTCVWFHASAETPDHKALAGNIRCTLKYAIQRILGARSCRVCRN